MSHPPSARIARNIPSCLRVRVCAGYRQLELELGPCWTQFQTGTSNKFNLIEIPWNIAGMQNKARGAACTAATKASITQRSRTGVFRRTLIRPEPINLKRKYKNKERNNKVAPCVNRMAGTKFGLNSKRRRQRSGEVRSDPSSQLRGRKFGVGTTAVKTSPKAFLAVCRKRCKGGGEIRGIAVPFLRNKKGK